MEKLKIIIKCLFRRNSLCNEFENEILTEEFAKIVREKREKNSQELFNEYYLPMARKEILKTQNYLTTDNQAFHLAVSMLTKDIADGVLDEFYRFK